MTNRYATFKLMNGEEILGKLITMTDEEIEYCLPVMELLGFKYKPEDDDS